MLQLIRFVPKFCTEKVYFAGNSKTSSAQVVSQLDDVDVRQPDLYGAGFVKYFRIYKLCFVYNSNILLNTGEELNDTFFGFYIGDWAK